MAVNLNELAARLRQLELAEAQRQAAARPVTLTSTAHEPRPGTWMGDSAEAVCRYCDQAILRDEQHRWLAGRDPFCHARAAGAPAKD